MERRRVVDNQESGFPSRTRSLFVFCSDHFYGTWVFCAMKWLGAGEGGGQRARLGPLPAWRVPQILRGDGCGHHRLDPHVARDAGRSPSRKGNYSRDRRTGLKGGNCDSKPASP